jgi:hypothetical protein
MRIERGRRTGYTAVMTRKIALLILCARIGYNP